MADQTIFHIELRYNGHFKQIKRKNRIIHEGGRMRTLTVDYDRTCHMNFVEECKQLLNWDDMSIYRLLCGGFGHFKSTCKNPLGQACSQSVPEGSQMKKCSRKRTKKGECFISTLQENASYYDVMVGCFETQFTDAGSFNDIHISPFKSRGTKSTNTGKSQLIRGRGRGGRSGRGSGRGELFIG